MLKIFIIFSFVNSVIAGTITCNLGSSASEASIIQISNVTVLEVRRDSFCRK